MNFVQQKIYISTHDEALLGLIIDFAPSAQPAVRVCFLWQSKFTKIRQTRKTVYSYFLYFLRKAWIFKKKNVFLGKTGYLWFGDCCLHAMTWFTVLLPLCYIEVANRMHNICHLLIYKKLKITQISNLINPEYIYIQYYLLYIHTK